MITNPMIPVWLMGIICIFLLFMKRKGGAAFVRQIFIVILLFVINLRIMLPNGEALLVEPKVDIIFVVDNTISMIAEDYGDEDAPRLDAVKQDCEYIMSKLPGSSYAVYTFNKELELMVPYTSDMHAAMTSIKLCEGGSRYHSAGTGLNAILDSLEKVLNTDRESYKVIFFISDGEIVSNDPLTTHAELKKYVDAGAVLGYGTKEGGKMKPMEWYEEEEDAEYLEYYNDNYDRVVALSVIDERNLIRIAEDFGVEYIHMTETYKVDRIIEEIKGEISQLEPMKDTESLDCYNDIYFWFVIPLVVLIVIDCIGFKKKG